MAAEPKRWISVSCAHRLTVPFDKLQCNAVLYFRSWTEQGNPRRSALPEHDGQQRVGSTSPTGPDAAVQPRWSLSRRLPPRATAVTGFGSPRRWRRTSSSEVERPLPKKRCGGLLSAAAATPQRSSSDSSQSEAVVASDISTDSSWPISEVPRTSASLALDFEVLKGPWRAGYRGVKTGGAAALNALRA